MAEKGCHGAQTDCRQGSGWQAVVAGDRPLSAKGCRLTPPEIYLEQPFASEDRGLNIHGRPCIERVWHAQCSQMMKSIGLAIGSRWCPTITASSTSMISCGKCLLANSLGEKMGFAGVPGVQYEP